MRRNHVRKRGRTEAEERPRRPPPIIQAVRIITEEADEHQEHGREWRG